MFLTQTCYDKMQRSKIPCFGEKSMVRKNKIIAEVNLKHLVWKIVLMVGRAIVSLERSKRIAEMKFLISPFWPLSKQFQFLPHVSKIYFALVIKTHIQFVHCTTIQVEIYLSGWSVHLRHFLKTIWHCTQSNYCKQSLGLKVAGGKSFPKKVMVYRKKIVIKLLYNI